MPERSPTSSLVIPAREYAVEESVGTTINFDDNTAVGKRDSELETRGLTPKARFSANFYPKFHTAARPFAQAITIAGHAYIMQAWVDLQNRINIMVDAAFPGIPAPTAGVSNKHAAFAVLPHLWTLGTTSFAQDTGGLNWSWSYLLGSWVPGDSSSTPFCIRSNLRHRSDAPQHKIHYFEVTYLSWYM
ncbi:hypothetical protein CGCVW01_v009143 [Colletotrichum viniferum]|nr:hypothetical protein CGCVW01_v009143 [Colletotrichum viniferum]